MNVFEIFVYLIISLIVAGILLGVIGGLNMTGLFLPREQTPLQVDERGLVREAAKVWSECGFGSQNKTALFTYDGRDILGQESFFEIVKRVQLCSILQDNRYGCGRLQNVNATGGIFNQSVVQISCRTDSDKLRVVGN
ncbi:MAG: hypothetical protein ACMXYF_05560 [Candidatus Woesearchaeota archaeon]